MTITLTQPIETKSVFELLDAEVLPTCESQSHRARRFLDTYSVLWQKAKGLPQEDKLALAKDRTFLERFLAIHEVTIMLERAATYKHGEVDL